jgi:hypothetical protein
MEPAEDPSDDRPQAHALLANLKRDERSLRGLLDEASSHWGYEDLVYRFWHQSWKLYSIQGLTARLVDALRAVAPAGCELNPWFERIIAEGTGLKFEPGHNQRWLEVTRPQVEAFFHARFMVEMAVKYGHDLVEPPALLPSGWATLLHLYELR